MQRDFDPRVTDDQMFFQSPDYRNASLAEQQAWQVIFNLSDVREFGRSPARPLTESLDKLEDIRTNEQSALSRMCLTRLLHTQAVHNPGDAVKAKRYADELKPLEIFQLVPEAYALGRKETDKYEMSGVTAPISPLQIAMKDLIVKTLQTPFFGDRDAREFIQTIEKDAKHYHTPLLPSQSKELYSMNKQAQQTRLTQRLPEDFRQKSVQIGAFGANLLDLSVAALNVVESGASFARKVSGYQPLVYQI